MEDLQQMTFCYITFLPLLPDKARSHALSRSQFPIRRPLEKAGIVLTTTPLFATFGQNVASQDGWLWLSSSVSTVN